MLWTANNKNIDSATGNDQHHLRNDVCWGSDWDKHDSDKPLPDTTNHIQQINIYAGKTSPLTLRNDNTIYNEEKWDKPS